MVVDRGPFRRSVLKGYIARMSQPNPDVLFDDHVAEILRQQGFSITEDPRSVYDPQQLYAALERYATDWGKYEKFDEALSFGFSKAFKYFAKPKDWPTLSVLSDEEVASRALKLNKSSGLPLMTSKQESLMYSFDREAQIRLGLKAPNPCVAYKRTQKGNKTRLVWGYPLEMTIMEARFARPLIDRFLNMATPMAFGMPKIELGAKLEMYVREGSGTPVGLDYSKYDTTISATMIRQAFRIISTWFKKEDLNQFGWDTIVKYFIHTPIVMPDGHLYTGKNHGVPSGSYFTQLVDSIVNVALCYSLQRSCQVKFDPRSLYVLGDDVIMNVKGVVDVHRWSRKLASYGMLLHDDEKTVIGEVHFLGAFWFKGKPDVSPDELVAKAVNPESYRKYEGQPHSGALNVLRSYASSYKSGWRLLPCQDQHLRTLDAPYDTSEKEESKYLSGSDKFLLEERQVVYRGQKRIGLQLLSMRYLL